MDLFRVERFMGDDGNEPDQRDESRRLAQLQRDIAERKRKRQMLEQDGESYERSNKIKFPDSNQMKSDVQEEVKSGKKAKKKKQKTAEENLEKVKDKSMSKNGSKEENDEVKNDIPINDSQEERLVEENSDKIKYKKIPKKGLKKERKDEIQNDNPNDDSQKDRLSKNAKTKAEKKGNKKTLLNNESKERDFEQEDFSQENEDNVGEMLGETPQEKSEETGFTVIGGQRKNKELKKVQRVLPDWLAKPTTINSDLSANMTPVDKIPYLESHIVTKLQHHDINHLFPVQSIIIPAVLSQMDTNSLLGRGGYAPGDICVSAPTGSGKTLAYVLPIVQILMKRVVCHLRALIILPTKDLANQVKQVFEMFTEGTNLRVGLASGSNSFTKNQEQLVNQG